MPSGAGAAAAVALALAFAVAVDVAFALGFAAAAGSVVAVESTGGVGRSQALNNASVKIATRARRIRIEA
jgi:hypothetical protein